MTIAVAIRTSSAVVFAADSKVTTRGMVGFEEDGSPRWQDQTYDNAYKIVHDRSQKTMIMVAGAANIGQMQTTDFISTRSLNIDGDDNKQAQAIADLAAEMFKQIEESWSQSKVPPDQWPGPTIILAAPSPDGKRPRVWRIVLEGGETQVQEILTSPGIRLEGSYSQTYPLLYGYDASVMVALAKDLGLELEAVGKSLQSLKVMKPIDKLNLYTMPTQDAIDFAVFLAKCQVEMERFLPGAPLCGGPIDVMVLHMAPEAQIRSYPGKSIHHPHAMMQK